MLIHTHCPLATCTLKNLTWRSCQDDATHQSMLTRTHYRLAGADLPEYVDTHSLWTGYHPFCFTRNIFLTRSRKIGQKDHSPKDNAAVLCPTSKIKRNKKPHTKVWMPCVHIPIPQKISKMLQERLWTRFV